MTTECPARNQEPREAGAAVAPARRLDGVLVVERDPELRVYLSRALLGGKISHTAVSSASEALALLGRNAFGLVLVGIESEESVRFIEGTVRSGPGTPVVAMSRVATPELVRDVLRAGAADFLLGPTDLHSLCVRLESIVESRRATGSPTTAEHPATAPEAEPAEAAASPTQGAGEWHIVSKNRKMQRVLEIAETIAPTDSTVLIQGESGTGKELIARRIHDLSSRRDRDFVEVNCGALPESLLESQLFGHEKGSFTGAVQRQIGLFEIADKSTIFLDEIGELGLDMQVKLLRVLQFREFRRIGGSQVVRVDVRVIAATNRDLAAEVDRKAFRPDLFYRLNVISLNVPPLRERVDEIPDLVELFAERISRDRGVSRKSFSPESIARLQTCRWTGNVRELENAVERAILLGKGDRVEVSDLDECLGDSRKPSTESAFAASMTLDDVKRIHIANVLRENHGNKMRTARILKINVKTLYNLMKRLEIPEQ